MPALKKFADIALGDPLPAIKDGPVSRSQLALFAGASGDHNPIHLDDAEAQAGGLPGVIVHGMLMMAMLGRMLSNWVGQSQVKEFSSRFAAMAVPSDSITCSGEVLALRKTGDGGLVEVKIRAQNQRGETLLKGTATILLK